MLSVDSRTNAAQFIIGRAAFGRQLHALGILKDAVVPFDSAAADLLTGMYHDVGLDSFREALAEYVGSMAILLRYNMVEVF